MKWSSGDLALNIFLHQPLSGIEKVACAKLLGITFQQDLGFETQLDHVLRTCSQRSYIMKLLRDQGLAVHNMDVVFPCLNIVKSEICNVCLRWSPYSYSKKNRLSAFLRQMQCTDIVLLARYMTLSLFCEI